jgi:SP family general alpha glucoside:H+ symporter-like MFS transporter
LLESRKDRSPRTSIFRYAAGYDVVIIGSFYGHPSFLRRFGETAEDGTRYIPAQWQSALSNGSSAGGIIGLMINGWAAERFGPKQVYLAGMVAMVGAIFITFFANSLGKSRVEPHCVL